MTSNTEETEVEQFCEDLQDLLELIPPKDVLFIIGDWSSDVCSSDLQAYAPTSNTEEAEVELFYEDLQDLLELTPKKDVLLHSSPL